MLIILEGCDATGKTTVANLLAKTYNAQVIHCTAETPNTIEFFREISYAAKHENIVADRFCYGQFVYQEEHERPIVNIDGCRFSDSWNALYYLESSMLSHPVKLIYTYADADVICSRMIKRGENPKDVDKILKGYADLWKKTLIKPIIFKT